MFLALLLTLTAQAAPHALGERLAQFVPDGFSEGVTTAGYPCRVAFSHLEAKRPSVRYLRAMVMAEPTGVPVEVEIFLDGYRGKAYGRWGAHGASARYRGQSLSAERARRGVLVKATNGRQSSSCLVTR